MVTKINGTLGIDQVKDGTVETADLAFNPFGFKNRIINGAMEVNQRTLPATVNTDLVFGFDRIVAGRGSSNGGVFTVSKTIAVVDGATKTFNRITVDTPSATLVGADAFVRGFESRLESSNVKDLEGKQITFSFIFRSNLSGTFSTAIGGFGSQLQAYVTEFNHVAGETTKVRFTTTVVPQNIFTNSVAVNNGATVYVGFIGESFETSVLNDWNPPEGEVLRVASPNQVNWTATAGNFIEVTELQLEEGTEATPFERRPYGLELSLCQRYFQWLDRINGETDWTGFAETTSLLKGDIPVVVSMRASPTFSGVARISPNGVGVSAQLSSNVIASCEPNSPSCALSITKPTANLTIGSVYQFDFSVPAGGQRPSLSAEL